MTVCAHHGKLDGMRPVTTLHLLSTVLFAVAFVACSTGGYLAANTPADAGANIGAGILMGFGTLVGGVALVLAAVALVVHLRTRGGRVAAAR